MSVTNTMTLVLLSPIERQFPGLQKILQAAKTCSAPEGLRYYDARQQSALPIAAITGLADSLPTQESVWLRADPVELRTDINSAYFFGQRMLQLDDNQAQRIAAYIAPLFDDYNATLRVASAYRWYLQLATDPGIHSAAPATLLGQSVREYLQETDIAWRKLFTELQMALQLCPDNQQLPTPITALWFWGGGCLPKIKPTGWQNIFASDSLSRGLASLLKIPCSKLHAETELTNNALWVVGEADDVEAITDRLYDALKRQHLSELNIYSGGANYHHVQAQKLAPWWRFW